MELSVCIATWCRKDDLFQIVERLECQTLSRELYEIIIVDSKSPDGTSQTVERLLSLYDNLFYIPDAPNILAAKRNEGIKKARGDIIVFMDDDVYPERTFLEAHYLANKGNDHTFFCGQIRFDQSLIQKSNYYRFRDEQHLSSKDIGKDLGFNKIVVMNLSFRKEFIDVVGYVNENFIGYGCEDMDFGFRVIEKGFSIRYLPDAVAIHREKSSSIIEYGIKLYKTGLYGARILQNECPAAYRAIFGKHSLVKRIIRNSLIRGILAKKLLKHDGNKNKYSYLQYKLYLYSMLELGIKDQKKQAALSLEQAKHGW